MTIYRVDVDSLSLARVPRTTFKAIGMLETKGLRPLLAKNIGALSESLSSDPEDELLVLKQEYRGWEDAGRSVDILAIDKRGRPVVIEVKRTEDAGHADLQALRYAAMVSTLSWSNAVEALATEREINRDDASAELQEFLGTDDERIAAEVRVILVSGGFGRELVTTVAWLGGIHNLDISMLTVEPYEVDGILMLDVNCHYPVRGLELMAERTSAKRADEARRDGTKREWNEAMRTLSNELDSEAWTPASREPTDVWYWRRPSQQIQYRAVLRKESESNLIGLRLEIRNMADASGAWHTKVNGELRNQLLSCAPDLRFPAKVPRNGQPGAPSRIYLFKQCEPLELTQHRTWVKAALLQLSEVADILQ